MHVVVLLLAASVPTASYLPHVYATARRRTLLITLMDDGDSPSGGADEAVVPIDFGATEYERQQHARRAPATASELAAHLPPWAAQIALDPVANEEYEAMQQKGRAEALKKTSVKGRTWEELDSEWDPEGSRAGAAQFTPSELAEDYNLPLEGVCEALLELGVPPARMKVGQPVSSFCSSMQLSQLLEFLATVDPIAAREARAEETLEEMAEDTPFTPDDLVSMCRRADITVMLGANTRIKASEYARLCESIERETAWLPAEDR